MSDDHGRARKLRRPKPRRRTELGLLVLSSVIVTALYTLLSFSTSSATSLHLAVFLGIVLGLSLIAHAVTRVLAPDASPVFLPIAALLNGIGYVMISRLYPHEAKLQAGWTAVGIFLYALTLYIVKRSRDLDRYRYLLLLLAIALILSPLMPVIGENIYGERLWIHVGPISGQPIEGAKILLCIFFASYFSEKQEVLRIPTLRVGNRLLPSPAPLGPILVAWAFSMLVLAVEHDVGFAVLLFAFFIAMFWLSTGHKRWIVFGSGIFAAGLFVGIRILPQVQERITVWLHPFSHAQTTGYQIVQGLYGMGTGGLIGTGLGLGHPGFIPFPSTDMIFSAIGEEMGLLGTTVVVVAFIFFLGAGLQAAQRARSDFSKLLAAGLTVILSLQAFFIMGGITRLFPLTGFTLPFVAYGGSSLVANYVLIAVLARISDEGNRPALVREATTHAVMIREEDLRPAASAPPTR
ncbi:MAG: FtsW/RodA/SpoVE family cell cycle protein [Actinobacteria bacterium]|nr:FtsW/RodA/SpoVE family cell cycle protein [Actinomycetota bacterium]MCL5447206.1 FtsW/RodA/SpoVE family cell cycle protein [Actinomycetota bacterium]